MVSERIRQEVVELRRYISEGKLDEASDRLGYFERLAYGLELLSSPLGTLPWAEVVREFQPTRFGVHVDRYPNALKRAGLTNVVDILIYFENAAKSGKEADIKYFNRRSYEITREVFRRVGLELPEVKFAR